MNKKFITTQILIVVRSSNNRASAKKPAAQTSGERHLGMLQVNPSGKIILAGNHIQAA